MRSSMGGVPGPVRWPQSTWLMALMIAALVLVSAGLGARVTALVAADAAHRAGTSAARDLAEMKTALAVVEAKAESCLTAFDHDRAALQEMVMSAGDLNIALKTVSDKGWGSALVLMGSATAHLQASKLSIAHANAANCTE